jgi:hypothetical protein
MSQIAGCAGGGTSRSYGVHGLDYGRYYGARPWGSYPGYVEVAPGPELGEGPVAMPLPELGMPEMGGGTDMGMGMDFDGFDF